ncbi:hypothetical protein ACS0TY_017375 [Phlomoides rotata]
MPASTAQNLVSLFRSSAILSFRRFKTSAVKKKRSSFGPSSLSAATATKKKPSTSASSDDAALKKYVSSIKPSSSSSASSEAKLLLKHFKAPPSSKTSTSTVSNASGSSLLSIVSDSLTSDCRDDDEDESAKQLLSDASSILCDEMDLEWDDEFEDTDKSGNVIILPWLSRLKNSNISIQRKEVSRDKKHKFSFKQVQCTRHDRMVKMCATKLGSDAALEIFAKLGQESGPREYNSFVKICITKARDSTDDDISLQQIAIAYQILKLARERGVGLGKETYGHILMYLIDFGMVEEFFFFHELFRDDNPESVPLLAYYEMLLWISVQNEVKIQELCLSVATDDAEEKLYPRESLLLALCESDRKEEFLLLLETLDITKVTSVAFLESIFRALGKFFLEPYTERFLLVLKGSVIGAEIISNFILLYSISIPNLSVDDIVKKFQTLHTKFEALPNSTQYGKLIGYCCEFFKVHEALNVVDEAFKSGTALELETFHSILDACDRSCEFNLVHQIKSRITQHNLNPNNETFRKMILLYVKMKDFEGAYGLISDLRKINLTPTASMYNAILAGYFREKNIQSARYVLKQMKDANVKPDASTYGYLIANSQSEKDLTKFYEDLIESGISPTKNVFMALINAYASFGQFRKAKEVILDKKIPVKYLNEIKSVLVGALASNGEVSCALEMYAEMKGAECDLDPKAIKSIIEHFQSEGELNKSLDLLEELKDSPYWTDACFKVISHCVQHEDLRSTVDLLKQLKDKFIDAEAAQEVMFDEVFCLFVEKEPTDMHFGLNLLQAVKEELGIRPSRKSLDFLLSACVITKDSKSSFLIWKEYEKAGLPYNVLSFVRMYQALLASGDDKSAAKLLNKIPKYDPHVRCVLKACQQTYKKPQSIKTKGRKKAKAAAVELLDNLEAKTE